MNFSGFLFREKRQNFPSKIASHAHGLGVKSALDFCRKSKVFRRTGVTSPDVVYE
jgi:hypothetical protein